MNKEKKFIHFIDWVINELSLDNDDVASNIYKLMQDESICLPLVWSYAEIINALNTEILNPKLSRSSDFWMGMLAKYKMIYVKEEYYKDLFKKEKSRDYIFKKYDGTRISSQIIGGPLMGLFINISIDGKNGWSFEIDNKSLFETSILVVNKTKKWWFNDNTRFEYKF